MTILQNPLQICENDTKLGGISRMRIAYSNDIVQQSIQTEVTLEEIVFYRFPNWIATFQYADNFTANLTINTLLNEVGIEERYETKSVHEIDLSPQAFQIWYNRYVKGRKFVIEITNNNGIVYNLNPFYITYTYIGQSNFENLNRYELTFTRAKFNATQLLNRAIIKNITAVTINYGGPSTNDVTIVLYNNIDTNLFNYGYSLTDNPETIIYQTDPTSNIIYNLSDGEYYFFAVHRILTTYYDVKKVIVQAGQISILNYNPQIITENESIEDEGTFVAE